MAVLSYRQGTVLDLALVMEAIEAQYALIDSDVRFLLWNLIGCTISDQFDNLSVDGVVGALKAHHGTRGVLMRIALVFDPVIHGHIMRLHRELSSNMPHEYHYCYSEQEALRWLNQAES